MIQVKDVTKTFRDPFGSRLVAVEGASLEVERNEFVCILGPSGCGKSTLLNILSGLDNEFDGEARVGFGAETPVVSYVFQQPRLLPWLSVKKNLEFALESRMVSKQEWASRIDKELSAVGLHGFENYYPHQLSGGMRQRTALARALAVEPEVFLMDEPFSGLDELTARNLRRLLIQLFQELEKTVLFVTHNCFEATVLADRILLMSARPGQIYDSIDVGLSRPRDHDDPKVFARSAEILQHFVKTCGETAIDDVRI